MSRTQYYAASSLDGFLADPNDSLDWLLRQALEPNGANDYAAFIAGVGAIVMGSTTYEWILAHNAWEYTQPVWVMTSRSLPLPESVAPGASADVRFSRAPISEVHAELSTAAAAQNIWVMGGGELAGQFADAGLLDEVILSIAPVVLGAGKRVLPRRLDLELLNIGRNGAFVTTRHRVSGLLTEDRAG